jgi:hypothetical protein
LCPLNSMSVAPVTVLLTDRGPNKEEQANPFEQRGLIIICGNMAFICDELTLKKEDRSLWRCSQGCEAGEVWLHNAN